MSPASARRGTRARWARGSRLDRPPQSVEVPVRARGPCEIAAVEASIHDLKGRQPRAIEDDTFEVNRFEVDIVRFLAAPINVGEGKLRITALIRKLISR